VTRAAADMVETDAAVEVSIELPGLEEKDIDVSVTHDTLTIKGEKKVDRQEEKTGYYVAERSYGSVYRSMPLPSGVDVDRIEATFRNGVLTVTLPKTAETQAEVHKVEVKAA
jgi:HSP20 family protein